MAKVTLGTLASLANQTSAITTINNNSTLIQTAIENTLSRDGTAPNAMGANLDMNSNRILNLPAPSSDLEPIRLTDFNTALVVHGTSLVTPSTTTSNGIPRWSSTTGLSLANSGVTIDNSNNVAVPGSLSISSNFSVTGTSALTGNSTVTGNLSVGGNLAITGTSSFTGNAYFKSGYPWADVIAWGADPTGSADSTTAFQNAINALKANVVAGGILFVPPGNFKVTGGLTITGQVSILGTGAGTSIIQAWHTDVLVLQLTGCTRTFIEGVSIFGKGMNGDTGTLGATQNALEIGTGCVEVVIRKCLIQGGFYSLVVFGDDNYFDGSTFGPSYGPAIAFTNEANWYIRCKFDATPPGATGSAWQAAHAYIVGDFVTTGGYLIKCTTGGTSSGVAPTVKNYGLTITDNTVQWTLIAPSTYSGFRLATGSAENHFTQCDFSGPFTNSILVDSGATNSILYLQGCVFSSPIILNAGTDTNIANNEIAGNIVVDTAYAGSLNICDSRLYGTAGITIGAGVSNVVISDLTMGGGTITIAAGAGNNIYIDNISNGTVVDGATGISRRTNGLRTTPIGYMIGAGGAVTQGTNRTTGVTLNKITGAITLVSAAGSATAASFTLTNSTIAATDNIIVNQKSGTDLYFIFVTAVAAGSCRITFFTSGGTTTEHPVFNFSVIKGAIS